MEQVFKVRRTFPNGTAEVTRLRESACSGDCHKCSGCGAQQQTVVLTVENRLGASAGDAVVIESDSGTVLKAAALLYILPLITFLAGYIIGENLLGMGILFSIAGFVIGLLPVKLLDRRMAKKHTVYTMKCFAGESLPKFTEKGDNDFD